MLEVVTLAVSSMMVVWSASRISQQDRRVASNAEVNSTTSMATFVIYVPFSMWIALNVMKKINVQNAPPTITMSTPSKEYANYAPKPCNTVLSAVHQLSALNAKSTLSLTPNINVNSARMFYLIVCNAPQLSIVLDVRKITFQMGVELAKYVRILWCIVSPVLITRLVVNAKRDIFWISINIACIARISYRTAIPVQQPPLVPNVKQVTIQMSIKQLAFLATRPSPTVWSAPRPPTVPNANQTQDSNLTTTLATNVATWSVIASSAQIITTALNARWTPSIPTRTTVDLAMTYFHIVMNAP